MSVNLSHLEQRVFVNIGLGKDLVHVIDEVAVVDSSVSFLVNGHQGFEFGGVQDDGALSQ